MQMVPEFRARCMGDLVFGTSNVAGIDGHVFVCRVYNCFAGKEDIVARRISRRPSGERG